MVLGPPESPGNGGGSLDVLSLGREGEIVLAFDDIGLIDGEGPDELRIGELEARVRAGDVREVILDVFAVRGGQSACDCAGKWF